MNLSALAGLGAGLQAFGGAWTDKNKQDFAKQLEMEREERAEARQLAKEGRDAKRIEEDVTQWKAETDDSGTVVGMRGYNANNKPIGDLRPATSAELYETRTAREKDRISLDKLASDADLSRFKADRAPIEAAQDDETHRANLGLVGAQTRAANYRARGGDRSALDGDDSGVSSDIEDTVNGLVAQAKDAGVSMADISRLREQAQSMPTRGVRGTKWAPTPEEANRNFIRLLDEFIKTAQKTPESLIRRRPSALDEE